MEKGLTRGEVLEVYPGMRTGWMVEHQPSRTDGEQVRVSEEGRARLIQCAMFARSCKVCTSESITCNRSVKRKSINASSWKVSGSGQGEFF